MANLVDLYKHDERNSDDEFEAERTLEERYKHMTEDDFSYDELMRDVDEASYVTVDEAKCLLDEREEDGV